MRSKTLVSWRRKGSQEPEPYEVVGVWIFVVKPSALKVQPQRHVSPGRIVTGGKHSFGLLEDPLRK